MRPKRDQQHRNPAIREIFLGMDREAEFPISHVARVVAIGEREIIRRIEVGEIEGRRVSGEYTIRWSDVATLAFDASSLNAIVEELGDDTPRAIPSLVQPRPIMLTLPAYQVEMLQRLAHRRSTSADWVLTEHLADLAASVAAEMEANIPGFTAAMRWPDA